MTVSLSRWLSCLLFPLVFSLNLAAQTAETPGINANPDPAHSAAEQADLNQAIAEAAGSAVDLTRALEQHLRKYPDSPRRAEIEASLYKTAADSYDHPRMILYGEKLLAGKPDNELEMLDRVIRSLLASDDADSARKALTYAKRYELSVESFRVRPPEGHATAAQWADLSDRALARATLVEARATGNLGNLEDALAAARRSWSVRPSAEAAHEMARWLVKLGHEGEALERYADAVTIEDPATTWAERDRDRKTATALYVKLHGSDQGLGDLFMQAWDRCAAAVSDRAARYKAMDPNYGLTNAFGFMLPGIGDKAPRTAAPKAAAPETAALDMAPLKGRTLVIDFWATWCAPCVAQHPLIEHVRQKYAETPDVVFLSLDTDDDHSLVAPFLKAQKWEQPVYLEAGLAGLFNVTSLPTILVIDPSGRIYSRMTGVSMDMFERLLAARIDEARTVAAEARAAAAN